MASGPGLRMKAYSHAASRNASTNNEDGLNTNANATELTVTIR